MTMGPLPAMDANADLQQKSIRKLNGLLGEDDLLVLRDERVDDFGVDAAFEARFERNPTNFRAQIQIKAVGRLEANNDGSFSKSIDTANLNYLLNGVSSLYILFIADTDKFYFTWASDQLARLNEETPEWKSQRTVVLRFQNELTRSILSNIQNRIIREGQALRHLRDELARYALTGGIHVTVSPDGFQTIDTAELAKLIADGGFEWVTHGKAKEVLEMVDRLTAEQRKQTRIGLVRGYAEYSLGNFAIAAGTIGSLLSSGVLSDVDDRFFANQILDGCRFQLGQITFEEAMLRRAERAANTEGTVGVLNRIEHLRFLALAELKGGQRSSAFETMAALVNDISDRYGPQHPIAVQARLYYVYVEGFAAHSKLLHQIGMFGIKSKYEVEWMRNGQIDTAEFEDANLDWLKRVGQCINDANSAGHPILVGEAYRTLCLVMTHHLHTRRFAFRAFGMSVKPTPADAAFVVDYAKTARQCFERADYVEGILSTDVIVAEAFLAVDMQVEADALATRVKEQAAVLSYARIIDRCVDVLERRGIEAVLTSKEAVDQDESAPFSPELQARFASDIVASMGLPAERFAIVEKSVAATSLASAYRLHWCRHVVLLEDLRHSRSPETAYAAPLDQSCLCRRFGYRTKEPGGEATDALHELLFTFCLSCTKRSPKH